MKFHPTPSSKVWILFPQAWVTGKETGGGMGLPKTLKSLEEHEGFGYFLSFKGCPQHSNVQGASHPQSPSVVSQSLHSVITLSSIPHSTQVKIWPFFISWQWIPIFKITKSELEYLAERVKALRDLTKKICTEKIESFAWYVIASAAKQSQPKFRLLRYGFALFALPF